MVRLTVFIIPALVIIFCLWLLQREETKEKQQEEIYNYLATINNQVERAIKSSELLGIKGNTFEVQSEIAIKRQAIVQGKW